MFSCNSTNLKNTEVPTMAISSFNPPLRKHHKMSILPKITALTRRKARTRTRQT